MSKMKSYLIQIQEEIIFEVGLTEWSGGILRKKLEDRLIVFCARKELPILLRDIEFVIDDLIDEGTIVVGEKPVAWRNQPLTVLLPKKRGA